MMTWLGFLFVFINSSAFALGTTCDDSELRTIEQAESAAVFGDLERASMILGRVALSCTLSTQAVSQVIDIYSRTCQFQPTPKTGLHVLQFIYLSQSRANYCTDAFEYINQINFASRERGVSRAQIASIALGFAAVQLEKASRLGKNEFCTPGLVTDEWMGNLKLALQKFSEIGPTNVPRYENLHFITGQLLSYLQPQDPDANQLIRLRGFLNSTGFGVGSCSKYIPEECCPNLKQ